MLVPLEAAHVPRLVQVLKRTFTTIRWTTSLRVSREYSFAANYQVSIKFA